METTSTTNTVTLEAVTAILASATSVTAALGGKQVTLTSVTMPNGFVIYATSTCVDPSNYSLEVGEEVNLKNIADKVWNLLGYELQTKLNDQGDVTARDLLSTIRGQIGGMHGEDSLSNGEVEEICGAIDSIVGDCSCLKSRLSLELAHLNTRVEKLDQFIRLSPDYTGLGPAEKERLNNQLKHMSAYSLVLSNRVNNIPKDPAYNGDPIDTTAPEPEQGNDEEEL